MMQSCTQDGAGEIICVYNEAVPFRPHKRIMWRQQ